MVFKTPENRPVGTDVPPRSLVPSPRRSVLLNGATSKLIVPSSAASPSDPASPSSNRSASTPTPNAAPKKFKPTYTNLLQSLKDSATNGSLTGNGARKNMFSTSRLVSSSSKLSSMAPLTPTTSSQSSPTSTTPKSTPTVAALSVFSSSVLKDSTQDTLNKTPNHNNNNNKMELLSFLGKRSSSVAGLLSSTPSRYRDAMPSPFGEPTPCQSPSTPQSATKSPPRRPNPQIFGRSMSTTFTRTKSTTPTTTSVGLARTVSSGNLHGTKLDIVSNDWKAPGGSSPKKNKGKKIFIQGDRFIPTRTATTITDAHAMLDLAKSIAMNPSANGQSSTQAVAEACGLSLGSRILSFNAEAPCLDDRGASAVRKMYSRHGSFNRSLSSSSMTNLLMKRTILTSPERVLDAPGLLDDYYLNLLDWSCLNVVAIGLDKSVFIWNAETGEAENLVTLPGATDAITSVSWAFDGAFLAVGTFSGDTQIWDVESKAMVRSMGGHLARVGVLAWDKHILSSGCRDGSIWNHDVRLPNHKVAELLKHTNEVCGLTWRGDGAQLASGGNDNLVNIWDSRTTTAPKFTKTNHTAAVKALAWCPWQNNLLASGGGTADKQIHFWNTTTGARVNSLNTGSQVTSIVWSKDYKEFMSSHGYPDNNISVYGYPSLNKIVDIPAHESRVLHTALSPDGQSVATVASDENLKFWKLFEPRLKNAKGGKLTRTLSRSGSFSAGTSKGLGMDDYDDENAPGGGPVGSTGRTIASMTRIR
ncbi:ubiquitin-protein transferase activating protein [Podila minutissima]|uniref:Ubiquitin-protein transferase activating protein n=1 Tax=Podila minutissima TaxID=64525 RepID=A0A9P5VGX8_9FUNG|nr:ubiquitin-protein transferase activating protein [Podila minutissima]